MEYADYLSYLIWAKENNIELNKYQERIIKSCLSDESVQISKINRKDFRDKLILGLNKIKISKKKKGICKNE